MPDQSTILSLPHILPSQAQKHVTHNEALRLLDVMVQLSVARSDLAVPPALPALGDRYIVAPGPSGAWAGQAGKIALWNGTAWEFFPPLIGWQAYDAAAAGVMIFDGTNWVEALGGAVEFTQVGVSMPADGTNRLAVQSPASLFTNPLGSHQLAFNKDLATSTASVLLQQNYQTRAEIGLVGDNDLTLKVSPNGTTFTTALSVNKDNGRATFDAPLRLNPAAGDPASPADGFLWYNSTTGKFRARQDGSSLDLISAGGGGGSTFSDASFLLEDNLDATKKAAFQLSGLTTATTRTYSLPDTSGTLAMSSGPQTFSGTQTIAGTSVLLVLNDNDATLGGSASARMQFQKSGSLGAIIGYNGATDFTHVVYDGNLTLAADHDNTEAASVINLMVDGAVVARVEPVAEPVTSLSALTGSKGDARYAQLGAANTLTGTFTASGAAVSLGTNTGASTVNVGTGATLTATTKAVNLGTGGVSGSTTNVTIGSSVAGALGALTINSPTVNFASSVSAIAMAAANVSALQLGLGGATADATNRLSLNAPASLFNHAGAGHQIKLNKAAAADTGSFLFQTGFSGRAEFGLTGSDDFQIKVSADGAAWFNALQLERTTGRVRAMAALQLNPVAGDPGAVADGDLWYNSTTGKFRARQAGTSMDLISAGGGGGVSDGDKGDVVVSGGGAVWSLDYAAVNAVVAPDFANVTAKPTTVGGYGITDAATLAGNQTIGGAKTFAAPVILTGQAADPVAPVDGTIWYNATTGQMKASAGAEVRVIDAPRDLPWLTPPSGEYVLTTMGAGTATTTAAGVAGRMDLFPFTARADIVVTGIAANCTTAVASSLGKFVVYDSDANGRPNALLTETATIDLGTVGAKTATASLTFRQGRTYWLGLRTSSTATISLWPINVTPDLNGGTPVTTARKILRRTLTFATAAPSTWGYLSSEISNAAAPAIWLRV